MDVTIYREVIEGRSRPFAAIHLEHEEAIDLLKERGKLAAIMAEDPSLAILVYVRPRHCSDVPGATGATGSEADCGPNQAGG